LVGQGVTNKPYLTDTDIYIMMMLVVVVGVLVVVRG